MKKAISLSLGLVLAVTLCLAARQYTFAQDNDEGRGRRGDQGVRRGGQGQWDPARMREMMAERLKESLDCTEEEWEAIGPLVEKVAELQMRTRGRGGMMRRPRRDSGERPEGGREAGPDGGMPEAEALRTALENEDTSAEVVKEKLTAYREAVTRNEAELKKAREALREVLSVRQEAQLVLSGLLD
jgi:hypothetical protein